MKLSFALLVGVGLLVASALPAVSANSVTNLSQELFGSSTLFTNALQPGAWDVPATGQVVPSYGSIYSPSDYAGTGITPQSNIGQGSTLANVACLTAGSDGSATPIPGCAEATPDSSGSGALQLTGPSGGPATTQCGEAPDGSYGPYSDTPCGQYEDGGVFLQNGLPSSDGLVIDFNSYQYNGTGADGIGFNLSAANPTDPQAPTSLGPDGGSLGYSYQDTSGGTFDGLPNGYLGFGLDVYGNYETTDYQGSGCRTPNEGTSIQPESVSVRGPGDGSAGYCLLQSTASYGELNSTDLGAGDAAEYLNATTPEYLDDPNSGSRPSPVAVEIALNPGSSAETLDDNTNIGSWTVPAGDYGIAVVPLFSDGSPATNGSTACTDEVNGSAQSVASGAPCADILTGTLPNLAGSNDIYGISPSWINQSTGLPYQLELGWTASTGTNYEVHEINNFSATTLDGNVPVLQVGNKDSLTNGVYTSGSSTSVDFTLTPELAGGNGNEADSPVVTDTFPADVDLSGASASGTDWTCPTPFSGQTVTCYYDADGSNGTSADAGIALTTPLQASSDSATETAIGGPITVTGASVTSAATGVLTSTASISSPDALGGSANDNLVPSSGETPTTTSISASPTSPVTAGTPITYTATVTATSGSSAPTGTVDFSQAIDSSGGTAVDIAGCNTVELVAGAGVSSTATCPADGSGTTYIPGHTYYVTAAYNGPQGTFEPSASSQLAQVVDPIPTSTVVTSSSQNTSTNTYVTYTATVTPNPTSYGAPSQGTTSIASGSVGGVVFSINGTDLDCGTGSAASDSGTDLVATCTLQEYASPGSQSVTATYTPPTFTTTEAEFAGSNGSIVENVSAPATTTVVSSNHNPAIIGQSVTYSASVTAASGSAQPAGYVVFDATPIGGGSAVPLTCTTGGTPTEVQLTASSGTTSTASCTPISYSQTGSVTVTAAYTPSSSAFGSSSSANYVETVDDIPTSTSVTSGENPANSGDSVVFTATVSATSAPTPAPDFSGTVTFSVGGSPISGCTTTITSSESPPVVATCTATVTSNETVTATYTPQAGSDYLTSNGPVAQTIASSGSSGGSSGGGGGGGGGTTIIYETPPPSTPTTTLPSGPVASTGMMASATPSVQVAGPKDEVVLTATGLSANATGTVSFTTSSGRALCSATVHSGSARCLTTPGLPSGSYQVIATYGGDANDASATAQTSFEITTMSAFATPGTSTVGHKVTLSVTNLPASATGTVTFTSGSTVLCAAHASGGIANCTTADTLAAGTYHVTARYSGNATYPAEQATTSFRLTAAPPSTSTTTTTPPKPVPTAGPVVAITPEGNPISVTLPATGSGSLRYRILGEPPAKDGKVTVVGGELTFVPAKGFVGTVEVRYEAIGPDGVASKAATVTLHVTSAPAGGVRIPQAHTGEPWAGWLYWALAGATAAAGGALLTVGLRRRSS